MPAGHSPAAWLLPVPRSARSPRISRHDPEYGEQGRYSLELGQRRILVDRQMCPGARRSLQVGLQHGRAPIWRDLFEAHLLAAAVS